MVNVEFFFYLAVVGVLGSIFGSFLNVVIYRLPRRQSIVFPASYCPSCRTPIPFYDNIPIFGYVFLGGKCRECSAKISPLYPLIEFLTAVMAMALFGVHGLSRVFFADVTLGMILLAAAVIDIQHMIIPDRLNGAGVAIGLVFSLLHGFKGVVAAILGGLTGYLVLMGMFWLGKLLFQREGVGFGDVKLAIMMGVFLGPFWCSVALLGAIVFGGLWGIAQGGLFGIVRYILHKKVTFRQIPFGPYLATGGFAVLFFRQHILFLLEKYIESL